MVSFRLQIGHENDVSKDFVKLERQLKQHVWPQPSTSGMQFESLKRCIQIQQERASSIAKIIICKAIRLYQRPHASNIKILSC